MIGTHSNISFGNSGGGIPSELYDPATKTMFIDRIVSPSGELIIDPLNQQTRQILFDGYEFKPSQNNKIKLGKLSNEWQAIFGPQFILSTTFMKLTNPLIHGVDSNDQATIVRIIIDIADDAEYIFPSSKTIVGWVHKEGGSARFASFHIDGNNGIKPIDTGGEVSSTDTDGSLCLFQSSSKAVIKNRLGQTETFFIEYKYID